MSIWDRACRPEMVVAVLFCERMSAISISFNSYEILKIRDRSARAWSQNHEELMFFDRIEANENPEPTPPVGCPARPVECRANFCERSPPAAAWPEVEKVHSSGLWRYSTIQMDKLSASITFITIVVHSASEITRMSHSEPTKSYLEEHLYYTVVSHLIG